MFEPTAPKMDASTPTMDALPEQTPVAGDMQASSDQAKQGTGVIKVLESHLDSLQDEDKAFLAEHLTPEFVRAIGLINGPEVAQYLNQFADPNKVLVPVPRQIAEQYMAEQKGQQGAPAQQGQPMPQQPKAQPPAAPMPPQAAPQGGPGIMTPRM